MSIHAENKHWDEVDHSPFTFSWASYLVLSRISLGVMTQRQQDAYAQYLTESGDSGVKALAIRVDPYIGQLHLSFVVEGEDEKGALQSTAFAALGGLAYAGVEVDDLEFVASHLVYEEELKQGTNARKHVYDKDYLVNSKVARQIFVDVLEVQPVMEEIAALK